MKIVVAKKSIVHMVFPTSSYIDCVALDDIRALEPTSAACTPVIVHEDGEDGSSLILKGIMQKIM